MNSITPKMAAAFGMGFMGFILAAYSYNQQHKNEFINTLSENASENASENLEETDKTIKKQISSFIKDIKKKNHWGQFWKGEYENMRSKKNENTSN